MRIFTRISFYPLIIICILSVLLGSCTNSQSQIELPGKNDVLNLYGIDPHTLDPAISGDSTSHQYVTQIFSGLVRLDSNLEPVPDIAEKWEVSDDGMTYTFHLRKDVKFHDGKQVTASDFKYSWERACNHATGSSTAETFLGDITGVRETLAGANPEISGVTVIDDYTLEVNIDAPRSYFLFKLTYPTAFVTDRQNVESGNNWWRNPNGTGPFKLGEWIEGDRLVLEQNEQYYGNLSKLSKVNFYLWGGVPIVLYETGEIDVTGVPVSYKDKVMDTSDPFHDELRIFPEFSFYYIGFNFEKPPFDDYYVRAAFSMAIDKKKITSLIFRDMVEPADGILPVGMPGFNENLTGLEYNPDKANEMLENSSYGSADNLPPITLTTAGWGGIISQELEAIIDQWRQTLGVDVKVRQLEPERYIYKLAEEKDELFDMGWVADYPHPQGFLPVLFETGVKNNYGGYSNPQADALLKEASLEKNLAASLEIYSRAEQLLVENACCIPLWFGENYLLIKPYVKDYYLSPLGVVMLDNVSVDKD
jgi:oligopeptide transport system substrate-binding protein